MPTTTTSIWLTSYTSLMRWCRRQTTSTVAVTGDQGGMALSAVSERCAAITVWPALAHSCGKSRLSHAELAC